MRSNACHGLLLGGRGQGLRRIGRRVRHDRQRLEFVQRTNPAMIEVGQGDLGVGLAGSVFRILLPIRLRGAEVELLFIFESTQGIKIGILRLRLDQLSQRRTRLGGRAAEQHRAAGQ